MIDPDRIVPLIVPLGYSPPGPVMRPLITGLEVALVEHQMSREGAGLARSVMPDGRKPISAHALRVLPPTDEPFWIQPPVEWAD